MRKALSEGRLSSLRAQRSNPESSNELDCRLRQNQDYGIGSKRKPALVEALKAHRGMTREQAKSCGENWARCGKPMAIGDVLRLRNASFVSENRADGSA
jgi:hypothetical protein